MRPHTLLVVVACTVAPPAAAGPAWASRQVRGVRILDSRFTLVCAITDRGQLDTFAAWFRAARVVGEPATRRAWTHKLDIDAPGGGRWLYDASSGDFAVLSMKRARLYRLAPEDQARFAVLLASNPPHPRQLNAWRLPTEAELGGEWRRESKDRYAVARGDFDGDGKPDVARLLVSAQGGTAALLLSLSKLGEKVIPLEEALSTVLGVMGIEVLSRGRHDTLCGKRARCEPGQPAVLELDVDGIGYFMPESSSSVYYLPKGASEFRRIWMSD